MYKDIDTNGKNSTRVREFNGVFCSFISSCTRFASVSLTEITLILNFHETQSKVPS